MQSYQNSLASQKKSGQAQEINDDDNLMTTMAGIIRNMKWKLLFMY